MQINVYNSDNKTTAYCIRDVFPDRGEHLKTLLEQTVLDEIARRMDNKNTAQPVSSMI